MNSKIDWTKPLEDTYGRPVRLICSDCVGLTNKEYVVLIKTKNGYEITLTCDEHGIVPYSTARIRNVMPKPEKRTIWVNLYPRDGYASKEMADYYATDSRIACVPVTFTEGDGLSNAVPTPFTDWARAVSDSYRL